jgi:hypothetical protein
LADPPNETQVVTGEPIIEMLDFFLDTKVKVLEAQLRGLRRQHVALRASDPAEADVIQQEINGVASDLERARERQRDLIVVSPRAGIFVAPVDQDMPGRFVKKGELVGYVIDSADRRTARTMISQNDIALVRERTREVDVLPVHWEGRSAHTAVIREVPGGLKALPTPALGTLGGGNIAIDPHDNKGFTALERYFEYEVALPPEHERAFIGQRVRVRFDHGSSLLARPSIRSPALPESSMSEAARLGPARPVPIPSGRRASGLANTASAASECCANVSRNSLDRAFSILLKGCRRPRSPRRTIPTSLIRRELHRHGLRPDLVASLSR